MPNELLLAGREAFARRRWREAVECMRRADADDALDAADLHLLATAAYLLADTATWSDAWTRAYERGRTAGELTLAARYAFWLGMGFLSQGDVAQGSGWFMRAGRMLEEFGEDCAERGWMLIPEALQRCDNEPLWALPVFQQAAAVASHFGEADLSALARHGQVHALFRLGQRPQALAILDELLVSLVAGEVSPIISGDTYCGAIEASLNMHEVRRAREWTAALSRWFDDQPDVVAFRGVCLVHRSTIMQLGGAWNDALEEATRACARLADPIVHPAIGAAYYQRAEVQRLLGAFAEAEESYRLASRHGRDPQPGLALLRLAQGQGEVAFAGIRRALEEVIDRAARAPLLAAAVDIALAEGHPGAAREYADGLAEVATDIGSAVVLARAAHADAAVLLAGGEPSAALIRAREAQATWRDVAMPYEAARERMIVGQCCRALGDEEGARMEFQSARDAFAALQAKHEHALAAALCEPRDDGAPAGLTPRELDILRLLAKGKTNRAIGDELVISEKTVARHVSNILGKLQVPSRTAAAAFAYEHGLR